MKSVCNRYPTPQTDSNNKYLYILEGPPDKPNGWRENWANLVHFWTNRSGKGPPAACDWAAVVSKWPLRRRKQVLPKELESCSWCWEMEVKKKKTSLRLRLFQALVKVPHPGSWICVSRRGNLWNEEEASFVGRELVGSGSKGRANSRSR